MRAGPVLLVIAALVSVSGCQNKMRKYISPSAYSNWTDRVGATLGLDGVLFHPCEREVTDAGGTVYEFIGYDKCFRFSKPTHMRGVWISEFEGSMFYDGATHSPTIQRYDSNMTWLEMRDPRYSQVMDKDGGQRTFSIDFIGRKSLYPALYGHMGMSRSMVIVDRMLSMQEVPGPKQIAFCNDAGCRLE